jgi:hypothetical protein
MSELNSEKFKEFINKKLSREKLENDLAQLEKLLKDRIPRDTGTLESEGIYKELTYSERIKILEIGILNKDLIYAFKRINAQKLAKILEFGIGKSGSELLRTQSKPKNPARTPTRAFFYQFIQDAKEYLKNRFIS